MLAIKIVGWLDRIVGWIGLIESIVESNRLMRQKLVFFLETIFDLRGTKKLRKWKNKELVK